ncbi:MAG: RNA polymerase sigma factor [Gammaproteobacteria bacterium]|nr:RNA polymerase sigma factor [Gammaproteobacteria bacterium]
MSKTATDQELLGAFYFGDDDDALATFVARHRTWALAQAGRLFAEEAEDIVQLSILRLMDAEPVGEVRNPLGWWRTIIAMTAMDQLRACTRRREQEREAGEVHRLESLFFVSDFVSRIEHAQLVRHIHREIDRMDERFRGPLLKRYFEDMSYAEIARILSLSPGTVASRLSRGIGQVRDALETQGLLPAYPTDGEETSMKPLPPATADRNRAFAEKWNDTWFVTLPKGARGIGHITAASEPDGSVTLKWHDDLAYDKDNPRKDRPEEADARSWTSCDLALQDAERFAWSRYRNEEAWINCWHEGDAYIGWSDVIEPDGNGGFVVTHEGGRQVSLSGKAPSPTVPDFLCFLVACEQERERTSAWNMGIIGFDRSRTGRKWGLLEVPGRYAGRKGLPTGLSHTYEIDVTAHVGRTISIWVDDTGGLLGLGDEKGSFLVAPDEASARELLASGDHLQSKHHA